METVTENQVLNVERGDDPHEHENSLEFTGSYRSDYSDLHGTSYINSHHGVSVDEKTSLISHRSRVRTKTLDHYISYTASLANTHTTSYTQSFSRLTTSNYFGFNSAAYATAHHKDVEVSKTLSLADIISTDRFTPSIIAFFQILSMLTGLSIFVLPSLVSKCGLWVVLQIVVISAVTYYTSYLINKCQYQISKNGQRKRVYCSFIDMGKATIKWKGEGMMKILVGSNICTDIYSLIFCAQITTDLLSPYIKLDNRIWMVIWVALVFPLFFIRKMSVLAWFGFFALALYVIGLTFAIVLLILHYDQWTWTNLNPSFNIQYFFVGFGVIMNTYNLHLAVPAIEGSMKHSKNFNRVNAPSWFVNTLIKAFIAISGAAAFGVLTAGSMLTNLTSYGVYATVVNVMIGLYMYTQYPTSMFVVFEMLDNYIFPKFTMCKKGRKSEIVWLILSRLAVSIFIAVVAVSLPNFEMLTSFIGNIRGTFTCITLPVYFYLKIHGRQISTCSKIFHILLIVMATLMSLVGAGYSIYGMI